MYIVKYSARVYMPKDARVRKLVRPSPYELVPNISQYTFNNLFTIYLQHLSSSFIRSLALHILALLTVRRSIFGRKHKTHCKHRNIFSPFYFVFNALPHLPACSGRSQRIPQVNMTTHKVAILNVDVIFSRQIKYLSAVVQMCHQFSSS